MIEEMQAGRNVSFATSIYIQCNINVSFFGGALHGCFSAAGKQKIGNSIPRVGLQCTILLQSVLYNSL